MGKKKYTYASCLFISLINSYSITLHRLNQFTEAQTHLEQSRELNPNEKTLVTWLRKNTEKLPKIEEKPEAVTPTPAPVTPAIAPKVVGRLKDTVII